MSKFSGKVVNRAITPQKGNLLLTIETVDTNDKSGKTMKSVLCSLNKEQIEMIKLMDGKVPTIGADVQCEYNVNPGTGLVSDQWVSIAL